MCSEFGANSPLACRQAQPRPSLEWEREVFPCWIADFDRDADRQHLLFEASGSELARLVAEIETTHVSTAATTTPISVVN
jgi:hypothetical protein